MINWLKSLFKKEAPVPLKPIEKAEAPEAKVEIKLGPPVTVETDQHALVKLEPAKNRSAFYRTVRTRLGPLTQSQVDGFEFKLKAWADSGFTDLRWLAYMLATAWHETAFTMQPVKEYGSEKYLRSKKYYPYYGRGDVQLTWKYNYERYGIAGNPERALEPALSAHIMIDGMTKGIFTGKKLGDYFSAKVDDPVGARRIINGTDKADRIAKYHVVFLEALKAAEPTVDVRLS